MSRYAVNSLLYRLKKERAYRERFLADPAGLVADLDLTDDGPPSWPATCAGSTRSAATSTS